MNLPTEEERLATMRRVTLRLVKKIREQVAEQQRFTAELASHAMALQVENERLRALLRELQGDEPKQA